MADLISNALGVSSLGFSGLSGLSPVVFGSSGSSQATALSPAVSSSSVLVQLSDSGQLLSVVADFRRRLEGLPASPVAGQASGLVDAVNQLQGQIADLQSTFAGLAGSLPEDQFALTLNRLASNAIASGSTSLASLQAIGIEVQLGLSPESGTFVPRLSLAQGALTAALAANPGGTQALLEQATADFLEPLAEFEARAASAAVFQSSLNQLGTATTGQPTSDLIDVLDLPGNGGDTDLLQLLAPDSAANDLSLSGLDLAALGLEVDTVLTELELLPTSLATTLVSATGSAELLGSTEAAAPTQAEAVAAANPGAARAALPENPPLEPETLAVSVVPAGQAAVVDTVTNPVLSDALLADRAAANASLVLQNLLNNPTARTLSNNRFDPAYAALMAASHLSDFILAGPGNTPGELTADLPAPVSAAAMAHAIGSYDEAARGYRR